MSNIFVSLIQAMFPEDAMLRFTMLSISENGGDALPALVLRDGERQVLYMQIFPDGEWHYADGVVGDACLFTADEIKQQVYERAEQARGLLEALQKAESAVIALDLKARQIGLDADTVLEKNEIWKSMEAEKQRWADLKARRVAA